MKREAFFREVRRILDESEELLASKNETYAGEDNVFHNFDVGASHLKTHPLNYLYTLLTKHQMVIRDYCVGLMEDPIIGPFVTEEKFAKLAESARDIRNYLVIFEAMLKHRYVASNVPDPEVVIRVSLIPDSKVKGKVNPACKGKNGKSQKKTHRR